LSNFELLNGRFNAIASCFLALQKADMSILDQYSNDIYLLCASHKVRRLYAFGSVLTEKFNKNSDIDLIVEFDPIDVTKFSLQDMLQRSVDLLEEKAIKNPYFKQAISQNRKLVYGH